MVQKGAKRMNGSEMESNDSFQALFDTQVAFQQLLSDGKRLPADDLKAFSYHIQAMVEELGELMKSDKRWKTHRNAHYDPINKLEELADVFVTSLNLALFSGFNSQTVYKAISDKIIENIAKLESVKNKENCRFL